MFFNRIVFWIFISTTIFFVLTEESDDEFIFHSEEEEDLEGYDEELGDNELSVSRKGSINFWWLPIICREGYFFAIWSILLFVAVSCCFTKLLLLEFLWWVFILLSVLSNCFEQYRLRILNRDRENSESDELLSLNVLLIIGFRTVIIFVGSAMHESILLFSAKVRFIFFRFGCWLLEDESESVDIPTDEDEVCWLHIAVSFWILAVVL